jgi:hypothetical protein
MRMVTAACFSVVFSLIGVDLSEVERGALGMGHNYNLRVQRTVQVHAMIVKRQDQRISIVPRVGLEDAKFIIPMGAVHCVSDLV